MSGARLGNLVFAQSAGPNPPPIIVNIFLRGGMDALSFLVPYSDSSYQIARPRLRLGDSQVLDLNGQFGLHPSAAPLRELSQAGHLGIVCAAGSPHPTRSHFEAQDYMDRGVPGENGYTSGGWLKRYLEHEAADAIFAGVSVGSSVALSLEGYENALSISGANGFSLSGNGQQLDDLRRSLRTMYAADPVLANVAARTLDAADVIDHAAPSSYTPSPGVTYPDSDLGRSMANLAQMIKLDLGLQAATIDTGGWDTHESQASSGNPVSGPYADLVAGLSNSLHAFWSDLDAYRGRLTVVVMSEFGRRLRENDNRGTDHGHGGLMLVFNNRLTRGGVHGTWPGLATEQLFENVDLEVTTDFRTVLCEIMETQLGINEPAALFPGFTYPGPIGLLQPALKLSPSGIMLR
jgi:uncharacterized protein (DUF1501 family)